MMIDAGKTPQATDSPMTVTTPTVTTPQPQFKDTFLGAVLLSVTVAVATAYATTVLIKRQRRGGA